MPIANILKFASNYILGSEDCDNNDRNGLIYEDNETLFCKNNVCVHPPAFVRQESDVLHYPGYLTVTTKTFIDQYNNAKRPTLMLTWIPNSTLRKCPSTVENYPSSNLIFSRQNTIEENEITNTATEITGTTTATLKFQYPTGENDKNNAISSVKISNTNPFFEHLSSKTKNYYSNGSNNLQDLSSSGVNDNFFTQNIFSSNGGGGGGNLENCDAMSVSSNSNILSNYSFGQCGTNGGGGGGSGNIVIGNNFLKGSDIRSINGLDIDEDVFITTKTPSTSSTIEEEQDEEEESEELRELKNELQPLLCDDPKKVADCVTPLIVPQKALTSVNITIANPCIQNECIQPPDAVAVARNEQLRSLSIGSIEDTYTNSTNWMSPELLAYKHNLSFPDSANASPIITRKITTTSTLVKCRRFSVDLSQMRSLRLFFNDENCTSGQLVIASRESQYKILHFHHGGLDHLAQVLHQWHCLLHNIKLAPGQEEPNLPYRQFMVCRPEVKKSELHPDEENFNKITTDYFYGTLLNEKGQIEDDLLLRKCVFFGGLEKSLRKTVWPFLLHCYSFNSTFDDRAALVEIRRQEYEEITRRRLYSMSPEEQAHFWRTVQCVVEKDVVRTDRGNPYFSGEDNPNIDIMKNILLNYAFYNSGQAYTQGMSDLLAPVLCEIKNESEAFWCFVGLMQRAIFVCTPTDNDIDKNLSYLRELIRIMLPKFYQHLKSHTDAMELLFCHRWILLCFKREFTEAVAIRMWEACWSNYLTDYFHLFLCLAIIAVYADDVIAQNLRTDEMLLHFSSLAMYMDGQLILRKARGLLHQYRQLPKIPCTLSGLCKRCGPGMWDSGHHPAIECIGHTDEEKCSLAVD